MAKNHKEILEAALVGFQLEIDRIRGTMAQIRAQLNGASGPRGNGASAPRAKDKLSAAARKPIAAAQRKRWAKVKARKNGAK